MRTFLWVALVVDQVALLLRFSVKLRQFEVSEFVFKQQIEHHTGEDAALRRALYKQLPQVKMLQAIEISIFVVVGAVLFSHLNTPALGVAYALLSLMFLAILSRLESVQRISKQVFMRSLPAVLRVAEILKPLWALTGLPPRRETVLPGTLGEFTDQLRRLPSTVLQPLQRQRLESVLAGEEKTVKDIMTPKKRVVMVEPSATLGPVVLSDLQKSGHGYFPVATKKGEPEGILTLSDVSDIQLAKQRASVRDIMSQHIAWVEEGTSLYELASAILQEKQYLVLVRNLEGEFSGVVTTADLMKHLLGIVKD
jgi:CBS domain containing-hemolysin-like protein